MNAQANQQHVTPFQTFQEPDAMGQLGASIAATKNNQAPQYQQPPQPQQQPVQPMHQGQQPVQPMAQPPMQQPQQQQAVAPVTPGQEPAPQQGAPAQPVTDPAQQQQAVTPGQEPYRAPVIDKIEGDDSGAGELGGAPAPATPEPPVSAEPEPKKAFEEAPTNEVEFDQALADLEKELGISIEEKPEVDAGEPATTEPKEEDGKKSLEREGKFIKIINELDSTNRKSLKKVGELEVENETNKSQADYYKQQAQQYYEELRANEFDRSKFTVADKAKNFVHYYNEYSEDAENSQAKNAALREAIKIAGEITGRDLTPYLMDYFSRGAAVGLGEIKGGTGAPPTTNLGPNRYSDAESQRRNAVGSALSKM